MLLIHSSSNYFFSSTCFFFLSRETTTSYSISASPNFGTLNNRFSFTEVNNNEFLQSDARRSFLSKEESVDEKYDPESISAARLSWLQKSSLYEQTGELPIGYGCSYSQTIFNGKQSDGVAMSPKDVLSVGDLSLRN